MNSFVQPSRRIASNLLWTPQGLLRNPLLTLSPDGSILSTATCEAPDRQPCVEFYAGVLVPGFPADYRAAFDRLRSAPRAPLAEQLSGLFSEMSSLPESPAAPCVLVVIWGLDYDPMRLTPASRIRLLQ